MKALITILCVLFGFSIPLTWLWMVVSFAVYEDNNLPVNYIGVVYFLLSIILFLITTYIRLNFKFK